MTPETLASANLDGFVFQMAVLGLDEYDYVEPEWTIPLTLLLEPVFRDDVAPEILREIDAAKEDELFDVCRLVGMAVLRRILMYGLMEMGEKVSGYRYFVPWQLTVEESLKKAEEEWGRAAKEELFRPTIDEIRKRTITVNYALGLRPFGWDLGRRMHTREFEWNMVRP